MKCLDCGTEPAMADRHQCEPCYQGAVLLEAREILNGSTRPVTAEHLRALDRVIDVQRVVIEELQQVVIGRRELSAVDAARELSSAFQRHMAARA